MSGDDDEEALSDVNRPNSSEMEVNNREIDELKGSEQCERFVESNLDVEKDETASLLEEKLESIDGGGVEDVSEKAELTTEVIESVVEGDGELSSKGNELLVESLVEEEFAPVVEGEVEVVDAETGSESLRVEGGDEKVVVETVIGMEVEAEFGPVVDAEVEGVVAEVGGAELVSELQMDELVAEREDVGVGNDETEKSSELQMDELAAEREEVGVGNGDTETEMGDGIKTEEAGHGGDVSVEKTGNGSDTVVEGDEDGREKVNAMMHDSEVGNTEKPGGTEEEEGDPVTTAEVGNTEKPGGKEEEEESDPVTTEEIPIHEVELEMEAIAEMKTDVVNAKEGEEVPESVDGTEKFSAEVRFEHADEKDVATTENILSDTKIVDDNISLEVLKDPTLDEPVNVPENREQVIVEEGHPTGDVKVESERGVELESAKSDVPEEIQLANAETGTDTGSNTVADQIPDTAIKMETDETRSDLDEPGEDLNDSPTALQDEEDEAMYAEEETGTQDTEMETETDVAESGKTSGGKRKRGNLSKSPSISKTTGKAASKKIVGEDVCFICFDGGDLVLCDRRGCPKAYHPSCVDRDEAFFKAKGRWNCGWHLCSNCQKNAHYMCWTCTSSLCKSCIKNKVILCVRGNKGFCDACWKTVQLIESYEQGNKDTQIDFDDRSSWEFLFKDYYIELKAKLSLTAVEIAEAKNPWKGAGMSSGPSKKELSEAQADANDEGSNSDHSAENLETVRPKRRKLRRQAKSVTREEELVGASDVAGKEPTSVPDNSEWASNELLEFIAHMKDGDTSVLSQFDVQALLLEYIKSNKLRDPRRKSQIRCDARLENLFGKPRVGHFEMLKLLESHFFSRDEQNDDVQGSVVDTEHNQLDIDDDADLLTKGRRRKTRRKSGSRMPQSNLDDYAAIDMHNISLIYLRRKLMEDLLEDTDSFHDKVVGTFVRIRISVSTQKQDLYRLVQVVGTSKTAETYKVGKKTTDIMVEILNLDKTEVIPIDTISNQEFTEEECKRLRQSIKCGLISRLTVGEILDKTTEIQVARVNDWLESETLRLSHLRDRASDMGRRKELRECVEKLQLLKTPEERRRRLEEVPEIHADPKMDPSYESEENDSDTDDSRRDAFMRSRIPGFSRRGRGPISPRDNSSKDFWSGAANVPSKNWDSNRNLSGNSTGSTHYGKMGNENSWNIEDKDGTQESNSVEKLNSTANFESLEHAVRPVTPSKSLSPGTSVTPQSSLSTGVAVASVKINESEKIWHYKDPSGKVQGPFSVVQLRKWNNNGYFPSDLRIWRATETQDNSILLADVLAGKLPKESQVVDDILPETTTLHDLRTLVGHSVKTSETSLNQDRERSNTDQNSAIPKVSAQKWDRNDITNLPSPTPRQNSAGLVVGEGALHAAVIQSPGVNVVHPSPSAVLPNIATHSSVYSPTPNSQQGIIMGTSDSRHHQPIMTNELHAMQMAGHPSTVVQPVSTVANQNLQAETQAMGGVAPSGQPQAYGWVAPNVQGSGTFSNAVTATLPQVSQPNMGWGQPSMQPPPAPNAAWGMAPTENNTSMGVRPENPNVGWGPAPVPANPNMGWVNPAPANTNMNWGPPMPAPPPANAAAGWGPPGGATMQAGPVQGSMNQGWGPGWGGPSVQVSMPQNGWVPPAGNSGPPAPVQGPMQGNQNQGWGPPPGNQGTWGGDQNYGGGGGGGGRDRDSGFGGGRPWNRQGGSRNFNKRDMVCPYNANGRCRKGSRCDYLHT